ncbi:hypothetical protein GCK72_009752 [Caenorhabditis remanei]|uniref:Tyrosine-protein phosphatase domain-containing protein n=1 Tax=Caenorhabditis remanei TaxID=31234 RepID=A0A6A5H3S3_CAERE|nr:hypothetical protein GCK72_009752 [Caenorhabditis remanei]KAF1761496.1 hypothetical protein GCK72_009752 [Caenorhabditis remanei]
MTKKNKAQSKGKPRPSKKKRIDDTMDEDEQEPAKESPMSKEPVSKEQPTGGVKGGWNFFQNDIVKESVKKLASREANKKKSKEKEKEKTTREKKLPQSAEKTEKETTQSAKVLIAAKGLCRYLLDMKESSLSTYFDERLSKYTPSNQTFVDWENNITKNRSKEYKLNDNGRDGFTERVSRIITIFEPFTDEAIEEFSKIPSSMSPVASSTPESSTGTPLSVSQKSQTRDQIMTTSIRCESNQLKSFFPLSTDHYMNLDNWLINTRKVEIDERNKTWMSMYTVEIVAAECSEASYIRVFNCTTWPWKKTPNEEKKLLALVRAPFKDNGSLIAKPDKSEPIIVMCDLGLDRSATVILTSVIIELVLAGKTPDCDALFKKMRDQRANVFTMSMFYTYAIRAALVYLRMKLKLVNDGEELKAMLNEALLKVPFLSNPKK